MIGAKKGIAVLALMVIALLAWEPVVNAQNLTSETARQTLRGLQGVSVSVEVIPEREREALTEGLIQTDVELRLRKAGIKILPKIEPSGALVNAVLHVEVSTSERDEILTKFYTFNISVTLVQQVVLPRDPSVNRTVGITWNSGEYGTLGSPDFRELREHVGDHVDQFINAYLEMNPKQ